MKAFRKSKFKDIFIWRYVAQGDCRGGDAREKGRREIERDLQPCPRYGEGVSHGINGGSDLEVSFSTCECVLVGGHLLSEDHLLPAK